MEDTDRSIPIDEFNQLVKNLDEFLAVNCDGACLDDTQDRWAVAHGVAHWLTSDKAAMISPEMLLPKATYRLCLDVTDEANKEHIVRLTLDRTHEMADGDFLQLQNFFWSTIGRAIRDNPEVTRMLRLGGIQVETDLPASPGGYQHDA